MGTVTGASFISEVVESSCSCTAVDTVQVTFIDCSQLSGLCGPGTVWDPVNEQCIVAIPTDTDFDGCVTAGDVLNLLATFGSCPPIPFSGPCQGLDHVTYQGDAYDIVAIGDQCWFAENLRVENFRNGQPIPSVPDQFEWNSIDGPARCSYLNDAQYIIDYGLLYNWHTVESSAGLCPSGWSVPSDSHWFELEIHLGMDSLDLNTFNWRGDDQGTLLKSSPDDTPPFTGTNDVGFDGIGGSSRSSAGFQSSPYGLDEDGVWWTRTPAGDNEAIRRSLYWNERGLSISSIATTRLLRPLPERLTHESTACPPALRAEPVPRPGRIG